MRADGRAYAAARNACERTGRKAILVRGKTNVDERSSLAKWTKNDEERRWSSRWSYLWQKRRVLRRDSARCGEAVGRSEEDSSDRMTGIYCFFLPTQIYLRPPTARAQFLRSLSVLPFPARCSTDFNGDRVLRSTRCWKFGLEAILKMLEREMRELLFFF